MLKFVNFKSKGRVLVYREGLNLAELSMPDKKWVLSYFNNYFCLDSSDLKQISSKLDELNGSK